MNQEPKILVVDDEEDILDLIRFHFEKADFKVISATNGESALDILWDEDIDLVVLDLMLPGINGLDVLKTLRNDDRTQNIPVILLTAKSTEIDRIVGFELGTDDYVCKPFSVKEVVARTRALLKRAGWQDRDSILQTGELYINFNKHKVKVDDKQLELSPKEFAILDYLYRKRDKVISREHLLERIWGFDSTAGTRAVDVNIARLRDKLGSAKHFIKTVKGYGYMMDLDDR
ncbi:MAG: response regulator transcription factor [bacterium]